MPIQLEWYLTCYIQNSDIYNWIKMRLCFNEFYNNIHSNMLCIDNVHTKYRERFQEGICVVYVKGKKMKRKVQTLMPASEVLLR